MRQNTSLVRPGCALFAAVAACAPANGQCTQRWSPEFGPAGAPFSVDAIANPDNGSVSALFVGGIFTVAGGRDSPRIAKWAGCELCYADCDQSTGVGVLDLIDFICFGSSFANGEPYACDCDTSTGPGVCDLIDFICFQNAFVAGCP